MPQARNQRIESQIQRVLAALIAREVKDPAGAVQTAANYSQLGMLLIASMLIGLALPFAAIVFARVTKFKSA
jgi:hypothetical protein